MSGKRILFYGDSNTFGYDPSGYIGGRYSEDVRWVDILRTRLKDKYDILGRGMNGRTIPASSHEFSTVDRMITGSSPLDFFAIMLGTNDILLTEDPNWEEAAENMENLISHIRNHKEISSAGTEIILISPPILFPGAGPSSPFYKYESHSMKLADSYRNISKKHGLIPIPSDSWYVELAFDGVHLSERGSQEFAVRMEEALLEIYKGRLND